MVFRRGFLFGTLAIPAGFFLLILVMILYYESNVNRQPVGLVDEAAILQPALLASIQNRANEEQEFELRAYPDQAAAMAALEKGEIQAFFILPVDYRQTLRSEVYFNDEAPEGDAWSRLNELLRKSLVAELPSQQQERLLEGPRIMIVDVASNREFSEENIFAILFPIIAGVLFFTATMIASNYMLKVVVEEKENRTMEILLTSTSADQLMGGKTVGLLAVCFTQLAIYLAAGVIGLLVASRYITIPGGISIPWDYVAIILAFFLPAYLLNAAVMVAIGGVFEELQQAQQIGAYVNLIFLLPIFLLVAFMENPSGPIAMLLTFFPPTAFLTISIRWGLSTVPLWQVAVSWVLLVLSALGTAWLAVRIFRIGMLQYGQPLNRKAIMDGLMEGRRR